MSRSTMVNGFSLAIQNPRPLLWTYFFNASLAWAASAALRSQWSAVTHESLAAQRLIGGFDLGVVVDVMRRIDDGPPGADSASMIGIPVYVLAYMLFLPGLLYAYQTEERMGLSALVRRGVQGFLSFFRILLLTLLVSVPVLGLAGVGVAAWSNFLDLHLPGEVGFALRIAGGFVFFLILCLLRLYFDLVEVHTVERSMTMRLSGKPDRRMRKALKPAWKTMKAHFAASYTVFVVLALAGGAAVYFLGASAMRHLAQPRSWPTLLLAQAGLFLMLFTRFWQRGSEVAMMQKVFPPARFLGQIPRVPLAVVDPLPAQEPIAPSLAEPDPGVFHHEVAVREELPPEEPPTGLVD